MSIESNLQYYLQCDHCCAPLEISSQDPATTAHDMRYFDAPLNAFWAALEAHWTVNPANTLCPTCAANLHLPRQEG